MKDYFDNKYAEFWIEDDILFFIYKQNIKLTLEASKMVVHDRLAFQSGKSYRIFCDLRGMKEIDKSARDYLAKEGSELVSAVAILISSPVAKIMMNFYLTLSKPITPTKMFTEKASALDYLKSFN